MTTFAKSIARYEAWMRSELKSDFVEADIATKHEKMRESAFAFLRATYWRWAETVLEAGLPEKVGDATAVLAVGDVHLENFGTWRDVDGRLIWGVNDFDEAAQMPFTLDLVRLATSALVGNGLDAAGLETVCGRMLAGYRANLAQPKAIVLESEWAELRARMVASEKARAKFWQKIADLKPETAPKPYLTALMRGMPEPGLTLRTSRRVAGLGSLGRPRWVAAAEWRGGLVVREAKAMLPSAWTLAHAKAPAPLRVAECAQGPYRAPDPWFAVEQAIAVRRLSPNNRKIDAGDPALQGVDSRIFEAMGREIAAIHHGTSDVGKAIAADLDALPKDWLATSATTMAAVLKTDFKAFKAG